MGRSRLEVLSILSPASTPHPPITSVFLFLYILRLRSCRLPSVFVRRPCLPSLPEELPNSWVPSLPGSYPQFFATANPSATFSPSFLFPVQRLQVAPAPKYFSLGRGRFLQLLNMSLSPCCPYHPAGVSCRLGQPAPCHAAFAPQQGARPPDLSFFSRPPVGLLSLRPGNSLTIPKMALSVGFIGFVILRQCGPS